MGPLLGAICTLAHTARATADISALQLVGFDGAPAGDGDPIYGISRTDVKSGDDFTVDIIGIFDLIAPAAIPKGSAVQSDVNGAPIVKAAGTQFGTALTTAANPGDTVKILVK